MADPRWRNLATWVEQDPGGFLTVTPISVAWNMPTDAIAWLFDPLPQFVTASQIQFIHEFASQIDFFDHSPPGAGEVRLCLWAAWEALAPPITTYYDCPIAPHLLVVIKAQTTGNPGEYELVLEEKAAASITLGVYPVGMPMWIRVYFQRDEVTVSILDSEGGALIASGSIPLSGLFVVDRICFPLSSGDPFGAGLASTGTIQTLIYGSYDQLGEETAAFNVRHSATRSLGAGFSAGQSNADRSLGAGFTVGQGIGDLPGEFELVNVGTVDIPAGFFLGFDGDVDLGAGFLIRQVGSEDLPSAFTSRQSVSSFLLGSFTSRQAGSADLLNGLIVRNSATQSLPTLMTVRHSASLTLPAGFIVRHSGFGDLPIGLLARGYGYADMLGSCDIDVRHSTFLNLRAGFAVRLCYPLWTNRRYVNGVVEAAENLIGDTRLDLVIEGVMEDLQVWLDAECYENVYGDWTCIELVPKAIRRATTYGVVAALYARRTRTFQSRVVPSVQPVVLTVVGDEERAMQFWTEKTKSMLELYLSAQRYERFWVSTADEEPVFSMDDIPAIGDRETDTWLEWLESQGGARDP